MGSRLTRVAGPDPPASRPYTPASGCSDMPQKPDVRVLRSVCGVRRGKAPDGLTGCLNRSRSRGRGIRGRRASERSRLGPHASIRSEVRIAPYNATSGTTGRGQGLDVLGGAGVLNVPYWSWISRSWRCLRGLGEVHTAEEGCENPGFHAVRDTRPASPLN